MCDNKKKTWLVIDADGGSQVCRTVKELEDLLLGDNREVEGDAEDLHDVIVGMGGKNDWKVYEISGSEAIEIDISFKMELSIRL